MTFTQKLNNYFQELEAQSRFSGVVLVTRGDSELYSGAFGYANRDWKIKNTLDTRFDTASVTKFFTAIATLQLIDQGAFTLETSVIDFLGLQGTAISRDVNVFHLLTHTSGIGDDCEEEDGCVYEDLWKIKPNYMVTETVDFLPQFVHNPPNFAPGEGCRYCNCSFILLGLMIEQVTGMKYRDVVRQHVFEQAGMTHSDFLRMDRVRENVAEGADPIRDTDGNVVAWKKNIYSFPAVGSPDSGAHVTACDLDSCVRAVRAGELLSPELTAAFQKSYAHYADHDDWTQMQGYVVWFYVDETGKEVFYEKEGINAGVSASFRYYPEHDINVVLLSNMEDGIWKPNWKLHEMVVAGEFGA